MMAPRLVSAILSAAVVLLVFHVRPSAAQELDLSHGGPIAITAVNGIEWRQAEHEVIATGDAKAVRGGVTVTADRLIAWYRKKGGPAANAPPATQAALTGDVDTGGNEVYRVQAEGNVHIYTATDQLWGDKATFDLDQAVVVVTGHDLRLVTPNDVLTAQKDLEYWTQKHMAVARGDAVVISKDGRRLQADTLVAYTTDTNAPAGTPAPTPMPRKVASNADQDPLLTNGKLKKVEAFGHVVVRTQLDTVTGDRAVYVPETGIARVVGVVHITRGQNQLAGSEADVDLKTGISRLIAGNTGRVQGLIVPNDQTSQALAAPAQPGQPATGPKK